MRIIQDNGYAIGWGTLALINAGLAQSKNRSGLNWFFISLFIGPLAALFIVVWEKKQMEPKGK
ncbi:hypothetical protein ACFPYJ_10210 [Paenibacillus solisilvae]|uniref:Antitermination protein NusB n=1 Tax=Paenibacillus solisilvae TaxID=2486751 RepID=A0ABW0VXD8_9BACL